MSSESSGRRSVVVPSAAAARNSARAVTDFEPGTATTVTVFSCAA
ncbi:hypothetical protein ACFYYN_08060 [Streptomyces sp. NPDC001902]